RPFTCFFYFVSFAGRARDRFLFVYLYLFLYHDTATHLIYTLSLHDALPISIQIIVYALDNRFRHPVLVGGVCDCMIVETVAQIRSEEHTSELQSRFDLVRRLLLEKKNDINSVLQEEIGASLDDLLDASREAA